MGEISEYYRDPGKEWVEEQEAKMADQAIKERVDKMTEDYKLGILKWQTQFNGPILIQKMSFVHLENTLSFVLRKKKTPIRDAWENILRWEMLKR